YILSLFFFFFSSRRRHTRWPRDWSSDVCSSDLDAIVIGSRAYEIDPTLVASNDRLLDYARAGGLVIVQYQQYPFVQSGIAPYPRSEERRVGKECRSRWSPHE